MDLGDFLVQIPSGLFVMVCGSGLLFIVSLMIIIQRRNQRKVRQNSPQLSADLADSTPVAAVQADPARTEPGAVSRAWKRVHDFFFFSEEERAERERLKAQAVQTAQASAATVPPTPGISGPPDAAEVLHLWRDVVDGSLIIQIGADYHRTMGDIAAAGQERRFMAVLRELARIAKETADEVSTPPSASTPLPGCDNFSARGKCSGRPARRTRSGAGVRAGAAQPGSRGHP